ncbi:aspartate carbamoyltransferase domain protein [Mycobacterium xenopi 4042]|uniref:Aspartate carbamoyltransferase domain protein n=1 Tax=Mycobacterium xenopi 4042 TaxID=1299334 RepID=X8C3D5_MYCXE|nr:aspartate carbamoyltransferase domain protein [Mycobacterium xenopi 4042]
MLAAGDLSRDDATAILDDADRFAQALVAVRSRSCRRCAGAPSSRCSTRTPPAPGVVRSGRQADERRRDQRQRDGIVGGQGRIAARHRADPARRRADALVIRHPPPVRRIGWPTGPPPNRVGPR